MLEADLLRYARIKLDLSGLVYFRVNNSPGLFNKGGNIRFKKSSMSGFPDYGGYTPKGFGWALELKTIKGHVALHQQEWIDKINGTNAIAEVARCFEDIDNFIERMKNR